MHFKLIRHITILFTYLLFIGHIKCFAQIDTNSLVKIRGKNNLTHDTLYVVNGLQTNEFPKDLQAKDIKSIKLIKFDSKSVTHLGTRKPVMLITTKKKYMKRKLGK